MHFWARVWHRLGTPWSRMITLITIKNRRCRRNVTGKALKVLCLILPCTSILLSAHLYLMRQSRLVQFWNVQVKFITSEFEAVNFVFCKSDGLKRSSISVLQILSKILWFLIQHKSSPRCWPFFQSGVNIDTTYHYVWNLPTDKCVEEKIHCMVEIIE
jgi:hypothetical protein